MRFYCIKKYFLSVSCKRHKTIFKILLKKNFKICKNKHLIDFQYFLSTQSLQFFIIDQTR